MNSGLTPASVTFLEELAIYVHPYPKTKITQSLPAALASLASKKNLVKSDFYSISREPSSSGENEWHFVRVAREELYFLLIDHMLIRYLFREKSFLSVYQYNLAWWASLCKCKM